MFQWLKFPFQCWFDPWSGSKDPMSPTAIKQKQYRNQFNNNFKNGPLQRKKKVFKIEECEL